jgi:hypothetical protein
MRHVKNIQKSLTLFHGETRMGRIPEQEIERLKAEVSVERLAEARGIKLQRHGPDLIGLCPFHEDHNPSLVITPGKNLWLCGAPHNHSWTKPLRGMDAIRASAYKPVLK